MIGIIRLYKYAYTCFLFNTDLTLYTTIPPTAFVYDWVYVYVNMSERKKTSVRERGGKREREGKKERERGDMERKR